MLNDIDKAIINVNGNNQINHNISVRIVNQNTIIKDITSTRAISTPVNASSRSLRSQCAEINHSSNFEYRIIDLLLIYVIYLFRQYSSSIIKSPIVVLSSSDW